MSADLKALHNAVTALLKARREVQRGNNARRKQGNWRAGATGWEGLHLLDQLERDQESAQCQLQQAETEVLTRWKALNWPA